MGLPIMTTEEDIQSIVEYLKTKATGAQISEAKAVLGKKVLDTRKISAYTTWGIISREGDRLKLDTIGRELSRTAKEDKPEIYSRIIKRIKPYHSAVEWVFHQSYPEVTNVEVAAYWAENHKGLLGPANEESIKRMAVCFFHICQAAGLGQLIIGRHGQPTRFEVTAGNLGQYIGEGALTGKRPDFGEERLEDDKSEGVRVAEIEPIESEEVFEEKPRVFISHSKNETILDQIKTILELGELEYEIAKEEETTAIPVPEKVLAAMRKCTAAVICVTADEEEKRGDGSYGINQNVLIEIGSAFVIYDKKVILVWDKKVEVPSNLQGLYRCEFTGDELSWGAGTKLMKAMGKFKTKSEDHD